MRFTRNRQPEGIHEPNIVPLIDVSLVLVVILLVATPMALQSALAVNRAAESGAAAAPARTERVEIDILDAERVSVNRALVTRDALPSRLRDVLGRSATRRVVVRCADAVPHGEFVAVLDEAKAQGAAQIAVVGR